MQPQGQVTRFSPVPDHPSYHPGFQPEVGVGGLLLKKNEAEMRERWPLQNGSSSPPPPPLLGSPPLSLDGSDLAA